MRSMDSVRALPLCALAAVTSCATFDPPVTARRDAASSLADVAGDVGAVNGCTDEMFVDRTASDAARVISFGGAVGSAYGPRCIVVAAGQTVSFTGPFTFHPLHRGSAPTQLDTGTAENPIPDATSGTQVDVAFPRAGTYSFHCGIHFGGGMTGAVRVR